MLNLLFLILSFAVFTHAFAASDSTPTERKSYTETANSQTYSSVSRFIAPTSYQKSPKENSQEVPVVPANIQDKILQANKNPLQTQDIKQLGSAIAFAKGALIQNTEIAKEEFGISDKQLKSQKEQNTQKEVVIEEGAKLDQIYNTPQYRDIFYTPQDSALINQAVDYHIQGKKMLTKTRKFIIQKVQVVTKPIMHVSSVMYNDPSYWVIFTNAGKFSYTKPVIDGIRITESSNSAIEFMIPLNGDLQATVKKLGKNPKIRNVSIQQNYIAVTLRTGECLFAQNLEITTKCIPRIEEIEKQIEI